MEMGSPPIHQGKEVLFLLLSWPTVSFSLTFPATVSLKYQHKKLPNFYLTLLNHCKAQVWVFPKCLVLRSPQGWSRGEIKLDFRCQLPLIFPEPKLTFCPLNNATQGTSIVHSLYIFSQAGEFRSLAWEWREKHLSKISKTCISIPQWEPKLGTWRLWDMSVEKITFLKIHLLNDR